MRVGILELQAYPAADLWEQIEFFWVNKQYSSVTTQTVSVWCRQMGHDVHFVPYYGWGDPKAKLPDDLDIVFVTAHTYMAPLAYALGKLYQMKDVRTVIGGPHAESYPQDCLRYFDLVVLQCDRELIADVIADQYPPHSIISSHSPLSDVSLVRERLPEIRASAFARGHPHLGSLIPMLSSVGCPHSCDFCRDWNTPYRPFPLERLAADLRFLADRLPGVRLVFHDPNFGLRFDEVMDVFESVPPDKRNPYVMETALSILHPSRLERLRETNCTCVLPSIESWTTEYSNKLGVGEMVAAEKLDHVVEAFHTLREYVPYLGTNFILGFDHDSGPEPFELTKEFLLRAPFVWPTLNIPIPFAGTPMFERFLQEGRILKIPFSFYRVPNMTIIFKNYDPITYVRHMVDLYAVAGSNELLRQRFACSANALVRSLHFLRTVIAKKRHKAFRRILKRLKNDSQFLAFHSGDTDVLPAHYARAYHRTMGEYAELVPVGESYPLAW